MAYKIKIGTGDNGYTDFKGRRIKKDSTEIYFIALIDEINALISCIYSDTQKYTKILNEIQKYNSDVMSIIAGYCDDSKLKQINETIEKYIKTYSNINIKKFIFFKGKTSSKLNLIRTKIRICETIAWKLKKEKIAIYLNRLSDLFFILAVRSQKN